MVILISAISIALLTGILFLLSKLFRRRRPNEPPLVAGHWLWGNAAEFSSNAVDFLLKSRDKYGSVFNIRLISQHLTIIMDPHSYDNLGKTKSLSFDPIQKQVNLNVFGFVLNDARTMLKETGKTVKGIYLKPALNTFLENLNLAFEDDSLKCRIISGCGEEGELIVTDSIRKANRGGERITMFNKNDKLVDSNWSKNEMEQISKKEEVHLDINLKGNEKNKVDFCTLKQNEISNVMNEQTSSNSGKEVLKEESSSLMEQENKSDKKENEKTIRNIFKQVCKGVDQNLNINKTKRLCNFMKGKYDFVLNHPIDINLDDLNFSKYERENVVENVKNLNSRKDNTPNKIKFENGYGNNSLSEILSTDFEDRSSPINYPTNKNMNNINEILTNPKISNMSFNNISSIRTEKETHENRNSTNNYLKEANMNPNNNYIKKLNNVISSTETKQTKMGLRQFTSMTIFDSIFKTIFGREQHDLFNSKTVFSNFETFHKYFNYLWLGIPRCFFPKACQALDELLLMPGANELLKRKDLSLYLRRATKYMIEQHQTEGDIKGHNLVYLHVNYNTFRLSFWTLNYIFEDNRVRLALLKELDQVVEVNKCSQSGDVILTERIIEGMQVLDSIVRETCRLTSGVFVVRYVTEDCLFETSDKKEHLLRKGDRVAIYPPAIHKDPIIFEDPKIFKYDRFIETQFYASLDDKKDNRKPIKNPIMPFGTLCPGKNYALLQLKLYVITVMTRYNLVLEPGKKVEIEVKYHGHEILPPKEDISVTLIPISNSPNIRFED